MWRENLIVMPVPCIIVVADSNGEVFKDIHNTDLVYLKFKYAYGDAEDGESLSTDFSLNN